MFVEEDAEPVFVFLKFVKADPEVDDVEDPDIVPPDVAMDDSVIVPPDVVLPVLVRADPEVAVIEDPVIVVSDKAIDGPVIVTPDEVTEDPRMLNDDNAEPGF